MTTIVKVTGTTFVRDLNSGALVNKDTSGLQAYQEKRKLAESQRTEINKVQSEIRSMKDDMASIKELLNKLLEKSNG